LKNPDPTACSATGSDAGVFGRLACFGRLDGDVTFAGGNDPRGLIEVRFLLMYKEWCQNTFSRLIFSYDDQDR
jgi:hypothetical protein